MVISLVNRDEQVNIFELLTVLIIAFIGYYSGKIGNHLYGGIGFCFGLIFGICGSVLCYVKLRKRILESPQKTTWTPPAEPDQTGTEQQ